MKVIMDADCLIKLTKAQLKEGVCAAFEVSIPAKVRGEVMADAALHPECAIVQRNLDSGALLEVAGSRRHAKGEDALLAACEDGGYAGIASDDKRFIKRLRLLGMSYLTPAVMLLLMVTRKRISIDEGFAALAKLSPMISDAETAVVKLKLESLQDKR